MIVVDASAAVDLLLRLEGSRRIAAAISAESALDAPELIETEFVSCLRRWNRSGKIDAGRAREALDDFAALPLKLHRHSPLRSRVWDLRDHFSAYDATYVALAQSLDSPLLTTDARLRRTAASLIALVELE
ncbi:MAG: type II toxin-antitoxin system VapC family toxin [Solirubrobacterales bacterium]